MPILPPDPPAGAAPHIPTGQELYDLIMGNIEQELTTEGLKMLKVKYAGETTEEKYARKKRYDVAFGRYKEAYEGYIATLQAQMERYRRHSFRQIETDDQQVEQGLLGKIQSAMGEAA